MRIYAYPQDRKRLLRNGCMSVIKYSGDLPENVARRTWREMQEVAELMGLGLTEPMMETEEPPDWTGGRMVTVRAGVFDLLG